MVLGLPAVVGVIWARPLLHETPPLFIILAAKESGNSVAFCNLFSRSRSVELWRRLLAALCNTALEDWAWTRGGGLSVRISFSMEPGIVTWFHKTWNALVMRIN